MSATKGFLVAEITSMKGGGNRVRAAWSCDSQISGRMSPMGRIERWMWPLMSVMRLGSWEGGMFQYQT
jgi:hypothetical protein